MAFLESQDSNLRVERARKILNREANISKTISVTLLCLVVSLNKREHVGGCIDYFILLQEHEFIRELENT